MQRLVALYDPDDLVKRFYAGVPVGELVAPRRLIDEDLLRDN